MLKKGAIANLHLDSISIISIIAAIFAVFCRVYQLMNIVDAASGAYDDPTHITKTLLNAVMLISVILILGSAYLCANMPKSVFPKEISKPLSASGLVMAAGFVIDAVSRISFVITTRDNGNFAGAGALFKEPGVTTSLLQTILALFCALYFLLFGISYLVGKNLYSNSKIMALAPAAWYICRAMPRFARATNFLSDSELFFELCMICFSMIFFFVFARICTGVSSKGKMWMLFATGFPAFIFNMMTSLPRLTMNIIGRNDHIVKTSPLEYVDLFTGVFIIMLLSAVMSYYKAGKYDDLDEDSPEFNTIPEPEPIIPLDEFVPEAYAAFAGKNDDDEAFEIASQYSNQYMKPEKAADTDEDEEVFEEESYEEESYEEEAELFEEETAEEFVAEENNEPISYIDDLCELSPIETPKNNGKKKKGKK